MRQTLLFASAFAKQECSPCVYGFHFTNQEDAIMDAMQEDSFVVFVRENSQVGGNRPETCERELASYATYEEANRLRRTMTGRYRKCIIRYRGLAGGGD